MKKKKKTVYIFQISLSVLLSPIQNHIVNIFSVVKPTGAHSNHELLFKYF